MSSSQTLPPLASRPLSGSLAPIPLQKVTAADIERYYAAQTVSASTLAVDHAIRSS